MTKQHIQPSGDDCNGEGAPFLKFYASDYLDGTAALTLEQQGFYTRVLFRMWTLKGGLPDDVRWLGNHLGCDPRTVRRLRSALIAARKLMVRDGFLVNGRMMREIAKFLARDHSKTRTPKKAPEYAEPEFDFGHLGHGALPAPADVTVSPPAKLREKSGNIFPDSSMKSMEAPTEARSQKEEDPVGGGARDVPTVAGVAISAQQHEAFRALCDTFGRPGVTILKPTPIDVSAPILAGTVNTALAGYPPDVAARALASGLAKTQAANPNRGGHGITGANSYLSAVLRDEPHRIMLADAKAEAEARTEEAVQTALANKRLRAVANGGAGGSRRRGGTMSWDEAWDVVERGSAR